jgi:riboflavin kinase/FMN adenylyltransferase
MPFPVLHSPAEWSRHFGPDRKRTALTIGIFDGLHRGHQSLLLGVVESARSLGLMAAAITFDPHPLQILHPERAPKLLATLQQRLAGFEQLGLDAALVMKFDHGLSHVSAEEFVRTVLVEHLRARVVRVGGNFRFGHRHAGDVKLLQELGKEFRFEVEVVRPVVARGAEVSSTAIRHALREGRVADAARLLGRPFTLSGEIRPGTGKGRRLVVPTLNLAPAQEVLPKAGVYVTESVVRGRRYPSVTNIGHRPTLARSEADGRHLTIESHLFEFSSEVTSGAMEVHFWKRLRDEKKFKGPRALRAQIQRDITRAEAFLRKQAAAEHRENKRRVRRTRPLA